MNQKQARLILQNAETFRKEGFAILKYIADLLNVGKEHAGQELLLRALHHRDQIPEYAGILDGLIRRTGLFPYLDATHLNLADTIAYEYHRPEGMTQEGVVFHRVQARVYRLLLADFNVVLSAPTSFGKSLLIDALVATLKYNNIVLIVPTIALIDETRRRLSKYSDKYKIITHMSQALAERNIFVLTQERAIAHNGLPDPDLLIVDEFYKLQPGMTQDEKRSTLLNHVFYRLYKKAKQFYFLGPNIENIPEGFDTEYECVFIRTDYVTVVSDVHYVSVTANQQLKRLINLCGELEDPTLIYCRSPKRVRDVASALIGSKHWPKVTELQPLSHWMEEHYSKEWLFPRALLYGIGMHHGQVPRSLSHTAVKLFNEGKINFLICTSTLIEGVNTKAKNVIVLDNTIAMKKYDYFTFNNICGRSGRMFVHFVGNVYLFSDPPQRELPFVDIPVFTQDEHSPEELLLQIDDEDLRDDARERIRPYLEQNYVPIEILRASVGIDPSRQVKLAEYLHTDYQSLQPMMSWTGMPTHSQLYYICELMWKFFFEGIGRSHGVSSGKQLAFKLIQLSEALSLRQLIEQEYSGNRNISTHEEAVEVTLDFMRHWAEFAFPSYLMAMHRIQEHVLSAHRLKPGDYTYYASTVENCYLPAPMLALEEYGIPYPLIRKIARQLGTNFQGLDDVLSFIRKRRKQDLSSDPVEQAFISEAQSTM